MTKHKLLRKEARCDCTTHNAEAGGSWIQVQPSLHGKILFWKRADGAENAQSLCLACLKGQGQGQEGMKAFLKPVQNAKFNTKQTII